jgi:hypothetical protein
MTNIVQHIQVQETIDARISETIVLPGNKQVPRSATTLDDLIATTREMVHLCSDDIFPERHLGRSGGEFVFGILSKNHGRNYAIILAMTDLAVPTCRFASTIRHLYRFLPIILAHSQQNLLRSIG